MTKRKSKNKDLLTGMLDIPNFFRSLLKGKGKKMSAKIKVFTFNLRVEAAVDGINNFPNRRERILDTIREYAPDLIGFQEATDNMRAWLIDSLTDYTVVGCGRGKDWRGESTVIAFKKHLFELISLEDRWLSATPDIPGSTFGGAQSGCPRILTAACLKHREAEEPFIFLNTHLDHKGKTARLLGAVEIMQYLSQKGRHFIITGDMNARPDSAAIAAFTEFRPCGEEVIDATRELGGTFHGFGHLEEPIKIDYIFTDMPCSPKDSFIVPNEPINGIYISDHCPVCAFVTAK